MRSTWRRSRTRSIDSRVTGMGTANCAEAEAEAEAEARPSQEASAVVPPMAGGCEQPIWAKAIFTTRRAPCALSR